MCVRVYVCLLLFFCACTHQRTPSLTYARKNMNINPNTQADAHMYTHTQAQACAHTHTHTNTNTPSRVHTHKLSIYTHMQTHTHISTYTHTHTLHAHIHAHTYKTLKSCVWLNERGQICMQHTATHCNTQQRTATCFSATYYTILRKRTQMQRSYYAMSHVTHINKSCHAYK